MYMYMYMYELRLKLNRIFKGSARSDRRGAVSAHWGPRLKGMHLLDMENGALALETTGFDLQPILEHDV